MYLQNNAEHQAYNAARHRCTNPEHHAWKRYGGRGIRFLFPSFEEFMNDIGPRPSSEHTLERKNNNGNYEVGNVKWATRSEQQRNKETYTTYNRVGRGYTWSKQRRKWVAMIYFLGEQIYLGAYVEEKKAQQAYEKAKKVIFKENRWPLENVKRNKRLLQSL